MLRRTLLPVFVPLIIAAWAALSLPNSVFAAEANSCVACHSKAEVDNATGKNYSDWKGSIHDKNGVFCNGCHLGNPANGEKEAAHVDVYRSGDSRSTVYFKNVPKTCGNCHKEEFNQFRKSLHYLRLETTERGPNCVTCHGARATKIVTPAQMADLCTVCHNARLAIKPETPRAARSTLLLMNQTKFVTDVLTEYLEKAPTREKALGRARDLLQQSRNSLRLAKLRWHTFDLEAIEQSVTGALDATQSAWSEVKK